MTLRDAAILAFLIILGFALGVFVAALVIVTRGIPPAPL